MTNAQTAGDPLMFFCFMVRWCFCFVFPLQFLQSLASGGCDPRFCTRILLGKMARNTRFFSITFGGISVLGWFQVVES